MTILLLVTFLLQVVFYLPNIKEKGASILYYIDLQTVCIFIICISKKYPSIIDYGLTLAILAREICVVCFHASYHH